jgi:hypothetical protein
MLRTACACIAVQRRGALRASHLALRHHLCLAVPVHSRARHLRHSRAGFLYPSRPLCPFRVLSLPPLDTCQRVEDTRGRAVPVCKRMQQRAVCCALQASTPAVRCPARGCITSYARAMSACARCSPSCPSASPRMFSMMLQHATFSKRSARPCEVTCTGCPSSMAMTCAYEPTHAAKTLQSFLCGGTAHTSQSLEGGTVDNPRKKPPREPSAS